MKKMSLTFATLLLLACGGTALAQSDKTAGRSADERALEILFKIVEKNVVGVAEAMPADKYSFAPTDGEFKGVRTFGQQVKHAALRHAEQQCQWKQGNQFLLSLHVAHKPLLGDGCTCKDQCVYSFRMASQKRAECVVTMTCLPW